MGHPCEVAVDGVRVREQEIVSGIWNMVTAQDALRKLLAEEDAGDCAGAGDVNDELCHCV